MASRVDIYNIKKNPMTEWIRQFRNQTEELGDEVLIRDLIDSYVNNADPAM
jgi:hypothetical protein